MNGVRNNWKLILVGVGLVGLVVLLEILGIRDSFAHWFQQDLRPWLDANPVLAPFVFIVIYIGSVVAFMPGSIMTLAGGALFGPLRGTLYVVVAATTAAGIAFLIARYLAADWVESKAGDTLLTIKTGIERDGWRFVAITRLVPIFPYTLQNYVYGLTRINFWVYFWVTAVTMIPGTLAYVYAGFAGRELFAGSPGLLETLILVATAAGVLILVSMIPRWIRRFRDGSLEPEINDKPEPTNDPIEGP